MRFSHRLIAIIPLFLLSLFVFASPARAQVTSTWSQLFPIASPGNIAATNMVYDAAIGRVVLFGGNDLSHVSNDTWTWDGTNWTQENPLVRPPARYYPSMAYDQLHGKVVMFGGITLDGASGFSDTWTWDGTNWTQENPSVSPQSRSYGVMTYDAARGQVVLFGGAHPAPLYSNMNDTWTWDGTNWTQRFPAMSPSARAAQSMAYDGIRQQVVLFGGNYNNNDTWVWDGTNWSQKSPATVPPAREHAPMAFDPVRNLVVMFGGFTPAGVRMNDTWSWDGNDWTQLHPTVSPSEREGASMVYDTLRGSFLLFGGDNCPLSGCPFYNDTWNLHLTQVYAICPLYDQTKAVKSGSVIPVKLQLCDSLGNNVSSSATTLTATGVKMLSTSALGTLDSPGNSNPDNNFRFDTNLAGYIFNLSTKNYQTGTYALSFTVGSDAAEYAVQFQVK